MNENEIAKVIVDCCYHIHKKIGPGLFESVYEEVLAYELCKRGMKCNSKLAFLRSMIILLSMWRSALI